MSSDVAKEIEKKLDRIERYLSHSPIKINPKLYVDLQEVLFFLYGTALAAGDNSTASFLMNYVKPKINQQSSPTSEDLLDVVSYFKNSFYNWRIPQKDDFSEYRVMKARLGYLEDELKKVSVNPALDKKITKIEEEMRKLKVASLQVKEKAQKDMLAEYKEAKKKVFVIMPFAPIFDDVWKGGIERACKSEDFGYLRVDKISLSSWITEDIINYINLADYVIADITGSNPNVMFEFGWALAQKKEPIVIRQENDAERIPFDVKDIRYISYTNSWSGIEKLCRDICTFLKSTSTQSQQKKTKRSNSKK